MNNGVAAWEERRKSFAWNDDHEANTHRSKSSLWREGCLSQVAFRKLTVTVPPDVYERLVGESARRKIAGEPNQLVSALLRGAVYQYLEHLS
jgi:hypothetical protein